MKGLFKIHRGADGVQLKDVDMPIPSCCEVRIKIAFVGICGTDLHIIKDEINADYPVIMGHEFSGIIDEVGADVKGFIKGEKVVAFTAAKFCGHCSLCIRGLNMLCESKKSIGSGVNGAMAEYMVIDADRVYRIPKNISLRDAALTEPIACCVRSVIEISKIKAGHHAFVSGPGAIGQITAQLAKICGAIVVVGGTKIDLERLALAKRNGADAVYDVTDCDIYTETRTFTEGNMFDIVYECAGSNASANTCLKLLKKTGQYVQVGLFGKTIDFDMDMALKNENHIVNSYASDPSTWEITLKLLSQGVIQTQNLISAVYPLEEWKEAIEMAESKRGYKILITPNQVEN